MSAHALGRFDGMTVVRHVDLVVLALALPIFLGADLPLLAYGCVAVAWIAQRVLQAALVRRARAATEARTMAGIAVTSMIVRALLAGAGILVAGIVDRDAGLAAAVLVVVLFTVYFAISLVMGPLEAPRSGSR